jgi:ABC-type sugar transport system permease subunit
MFATGALGMNGDRRAQPTWLSWTRSPRIVPLPDFILLALLSLPPFVCAVYLSFVNIDVSVPNNSVKFVWFQNYISVLSSQNGFHALLIP